MFYVSNIQTTAPKTFETPLQKRVYDVLQELGIPFERVDTDEAITMEDCTEIDARLSMDMVKTLFLCNHQQTSFYLFITRGDKPFRAKDFSTALGIARVSFAPPELMQSMLGTAIGAATVYSVLLESAHDVQVVFDQDVCAQEFYGCSDGTTTGYMKIATNRIVGDLMAYAGCTPIIAEV